MPNTAIKVEKLCKQYHLGEVGTGSLSLDINKWWYKVRGKEDPYLAIGEENDRTIKGTSKFVWALKDVDFSIKQGEVVGIIGRNGAGKSTILKILSRTTAPTKGSVKIKGRVVSLLEIGTGFHPDLTGRDNIFLNGSILGMTRSEIKKKFDEIVSFAGVERYIETPVKRYSSGMYVRLAFAVAAHLESEILIVDEVLTVGDIEFQKKCLGKMGELSKGEGRTVLFVSHQMDAISRLCSRTIVLKNGCLIFDGSAEQGMQAYFDKQNTSSAFLKWDNNLPGNEVVKLSEVSIIDYNQKVSDVHSINQQVGIKIKYKVLNDFAYITSGINLFNAEGVHLFSSHDIKTARSNVNLTKGVYETTVWIPANFLAEGVMNVSVAMMSYDPFIIHFHEKQVASFIIVDNPDAETARGVYGGEFPGAVRPILNWETKSV